KPATEPETTRRGQHAGCGTQQYPVTVAFTTGPAGNGWQDQAQGLRQPRPVLEQVENVEQIGAQFVAVDRWRAVGQFWLAVPDGRAGGATVEAVACAADREALLVQQLTDAPDQQHLMVLI